MKFKKDVFLIILGLFVSCNQERSPDSSQLPPEEHRIQPISATIVTTASDSEFRLSITDTLSFKQARQPLETELWVFVNPNKTFQEFLGIGAAITDASAETFDKLSHEIQEELLDAYFTPKGINYSLIRTPIHSCDFSSESYTYIEDGDSALATFSVDHDLMHKIPMIKKAIDRSSANLTIYASPWSPPAFMKTNNDMLHGGSLLPAYYDVWALYYAKFIKAYEQNGVPIWGLTIQNEPMATQRWESCIYTAEQERDFLKNHLGPMMVKQGLGDKKIIIWDHNKDLIANRASTILDDPEASKYVWGVGFHWYETWTGSQPMFENLANVQEAYPDKELIFTEGCNESFDPEKYQYWPNAERYGKEMINDFNLGTTAWTDWNILLDETGGPNHVQNFCFAPVHGDTRTDELIFTPTYYYIGHFSKYIKQGAVRISTSVSRSFLLSTTWKNPDGSFVTIVMNENDQKIDFKLKIANQFIDVTIPPHAIQSILY